MKVNWNKILVVTGELAIAALIALMVVTCSGCFITDTIGLTDDAVTRGVLLIADREIPGHKWKKETIDEIVTIVKAEARLDELGEELAKDAAAQKRLEEITLKYIKGGELVLTPKDEPADPANHVITRITEWYGGVNLSSAVVDERFQLTVSNDGRIWSKAPSDWPKKDVGGDMQVIVCAAYQNASGQWVGGKYEWNRPDPSPRSWEHVTSGYEGWVAPPDGTTMAVWCASVDEKLVSTETTAIYSE